MGDLDELLSELNAIDRGDYGRSSSAKGIPPPSNSTSQPALPRHSSLSSPRIQPGQQQPKSQLDDLLDELKCIDSKPPERPPRQPTQPQGSGGSAAGRSSSSATGPKLKSKCTAVLLGPAEIARGRFPGGGAPVCCDQLRCTRCDFKVLHFRDAEWFGDADYMFFRNCYPDTEKLGEKLKRRPGSCCYACQCQWISCTDIVKVDFSSELRWVCGGHVHRQ